MRLDGDIIDVIVDIAIFEILNIVIFYLSFKNQAKLCSKDTKMWLEACAQRVLSEEIVTLPFPPMDMSSNSCDR
jgi:hypothetical protein